MIRKVKVGDEYLYYDNENFLFKIDNSWQFYDYILTKLNNIFHIYAYVNNKYLCVSDTSVLTNPDIIYEFESLLICYGDDGYYLLDSNYDIFMVTDNYEKDLIKYAINKLRKEKLKLLI